MGIFGGYNGFLTQNRAKNEDFWSFFQHLSLSPLPGVEGRYIQDIIWISRVSWVFLQNKLWHWNDVQEEKIAYTHWKNGQKIINFIKIDINLAHSWYNMNQNAKWH